MKNVLGIIFLQLLLLPLFGQEKEVEVRKEVKIHEKEDELKEKERAYKIKVKDGDDVKVIEWMDDGEIPEDILEQLDDIDIDIEVLDEDFMQKDGPRVVKIKKSKDGNDDDVEVVILRGDHKFKRDRMKHAKMKKFEHMDLEYGKHRGPKVYIGAMIEPAEKGVLLNDISVDSPAHISGLKRGDIIKEINGANVRTPRDLMFLLRLFDVNDKVDVTYERDGKLKKAKITLQERPIKYKR